MRRLVGLVWVVLLLAVPAWAVNKIYVNPETAITFADSAQSPSATLTFSALASGAGRISAQFDRGAGAIAMCYVWRATNSLSGTNVVGAAIEYFLATSDGTNIDGQVGTSDAALASDKRNNLKFLGLLIVDQTTTNTNMTASGTVCTSSRYLSIGVWNATTLAFQTSTSAHKFSLTPIPMEIQ